MHEQVGAARGAQLQRLQIGAVAVAAFCWILCRTPRSANPEPEAFRILLFFPGGPPPFPSNKVSSTTF
jgi:hypothetical protein